MARFTLANHEEQRTPGDGDEFAVLVIEDKSGFKYLHLSK